LRLSGAPIKAKAHAAFHALARHGLEGLGVGQFDTALLGALHDGSGERMFTTLLEARGARPVFSKAFKQSPDAPAAVTMPTIGIVLKVAVWHVDHRKDQPAR
jgi:hypothetical protein